MLALATMVSYQDFIRGAWAVGAVVPILGATFVDDYKLRLGVVVAVATVALMVGGALVAILGKAPLVKTSLGVLFAR